MIELENSNMEINLPLIKLRPYQNYAINCNGLVYSYKSQKFLRQHEDDRGYRMVSLWHDGKSRTKKIHRLMAQAFFEDATEINHIDGDKANNRLSNLEVSTRSHNIRHSITTGLRKVKINKITVDYIRQCKRDKSLSMAELAKRYSLSYSYTCQIARGERGCSFGD